MMIDYTIRMTASPSEVRTKILEAACTVFAESNGPVLMAKVADEAGISRAALYREFKGRRELTRALVGEGRLGGSALADRTTRARILEGARQAIAEHGVLNVTVQQIARAAGVGEASVYRAFRGKESLLRAAIDELPARKAALKLLVDPAAPLRATLVSLVRALLEVVDEAPETFWLIGFGHGSEERYVRRLREGQRTTFGQLTLFLQMQRKLGRLRKLPPAQLAGALFGSLYAACQLSRADDGSQRHSPSPEQMDRRAAELVDFFLSGAQRSR
jgi:AcrR family transcriptional regulator